MRFINYINEKYLMSEWTLGFELEAYIKKELKDKNIEILKKRLGSGNKKEFILTKDSSLSSNNLEPFELISPVYNVSPINIKNIVEGLTTLEDLGISIDSKCGFHVHLSYPNFDAETAAWIFLNILYDETLLADMLFFKNTNFFNMEYAKSDIITDFNTYYSEKDINWIMLLITSEKYNFIRLHPQGTIEWRGPRNFLNDKSSVKEFFIKLLNIINKLNTFLDKKEIGWFKREYLNNKPSPYHYELNWNRDREKKFSERCDDKTLKILWKNYPKEMKNLISAKNIYVTKRDNKLEIVDFNSEDSSVSGEFKNVYIVSGFYNKAHFKNCTFEYIKSLHFDEIEDYSCDFSNCTFENCKFIGFPGLFKYRFDNCLLDTCIVDYINISLINVNFKNTKAYINDDTGWVVLNKKFKNTEEFL